MLHLLNPCSFCMLFIVCKFCLIKSEKQLNIFLKKRLLYQLVVSILLQPGFATSQCCQFWQSCYTLVFLLSKSPSRSQSVDYCLIIYSFIFMTTCSLVRVADEPGLGELEIPHDQHLSQIVLLTLHQDRTKQGRRCGYSILSVDDLWAAFLWV